MVLDTQDTAEECDAVPGLKVSQPSAGTEISWQSSGKVLLREQI